MNNTVGKINGTLQQSADMSEAPQIILKFFFAFCPTKCHSRVRGSSEENEKTSAHTCHGSCQCTPIFSWQGEQATPHNPPPTSPGVKGHCRRPRCSENSTFPSDSAPSSISEEGNSLTGRLSERGGRERDKTGQEEETAECSSFSPFRAKQSQELATSYRGRKAWWIINSGKCHKRQREV